MLVVGGTGVLGTQVVAALARAPQVTCAAAGRTTGSVHVDLMDPETFPAMGGWDVVVNASDSLAAPPDGALAWVYDQGGTWVETSADPETFQRALRLRPVARTGRVILGAGVATGLSNLVAADAVGALDAPFKLDLGIRSSPLGRAGAGMVARTIAVAGSPAAWFTDGQPVHGPPLSPGPLMPFDDDGQPRRALAWRAPWAEVDLLRASLGLPDLAVHWLPQPSWLGAAAAFVPPGLLRWAPTRGFAAAVLGLVRTHWLHRVSRPMTLVAVARGPDRAVTRLHLADSLAAAGQMIGALCLALHAAPPPPGVSCVDEVTDLDTVLAGMARLGATAETCAVQARGLTVLSPE